MLRSDPGDNAFSVRLLIAGEFLPLNFVSRLRQNTYWVRFQRRLWTSSSSHVSVDDEKPSPLRRSAGGTRGTCIPFVVRGALLRQGAGPFTSCKRTLNL